MMEIDSKYKELIKRMYKLIKKTERENYLEYYGEQILKDILNFEKSLQKFKLPYGLFELINDKEETDDSEFYEKLIYILNKYVDVMEKTMITIENKEGRKKKINLFNLLIERNDIDNAFKEKLYITKVKEEYYIYRNYQTVLNFLKENREKVKTLKYLDELKYIELLCHKHLMKYTEIMNFLNNQDFLCDNDLNKLRRAYLYYIIGDLSKVWNQYDKILESKEENLQVYLVAKYNLKLFDTRFLLYKKKGDLNNLKDRFNKKIDNTKQNQSTLNYPDVKMHLKELQRKVFEDSVEHNTKENKRERKNQVGYDLYLQEAEKSFIDLVHFIEFYGVPDFIISNNKRIYYFSNILNKKFLPKFSSDYLGFGISDGIDINMVEEQLFDYKNKREEYYQLIKEKLSFALEFLEKIKFDDKKVSIILPLQALDALLKLTLGFISVFDEEWLLEIYPLIFKVIKLKYPQDNNKLIKYSNKIIVKIINLLSPEKSVRVFEEFLELIINTENHIFRLFDLHDIRYRGWKEKHLMDFDYDLIIRLIKRFNKQGTRMIAHYLHIIIILNKIRPIPESYQDKIISQILNLKPALNSGQEYNYIFLLKDLGWKNEKISLEVKQLYKKFISDDKISTASGSYFDILGDEDLIDYLEENEQDKVLSKGQERIEEFKEADTEFFPNFSDSYLKRLCRYIISYSIIRDDFSYLFKFIEKYDLYSMTLYSDSAKKLRRILEKNPEHLKKFVKVIIKKLKINNQETRIKTIFSLNKLYLESSFILEEEEELLELIQDNLISVDERVIRNTIGILATIIKNNEDWATKKAEDLFKEILRIEKSDIFNSKTYFRSLSYFLKEVKDYLESSLKIKAEELIDDLRELPFIEIKRKLNS